MRDKVILFTVLFVGIVVSTALYIVFGTYWDYHKSQALGLYTSEMYIRDMAYIRFHKIPVMWVLLVVFSLGYIVRAVLEWVFKKKCSNDYIE